MGKNGMSLKVAGKTILSASILVSCGLLFGCLGGSGDTDGGPAGDDSGQGTQFIPDNVGSISLDVNEDPLNVSEITGFTVSVTDANGAGVPLTRVSCDTEKGVAVIEPNTGAEITDAGGKISGKIGCESPGSYLFGCRAAVGANKRVFTTVHCAGPIPAGFTGFEGASGGGLGTGGNSQNGNGGSGGSDLDGLTIASITLDDGFGDTTSIDTDLDTDCNNDAGTTTSDIEPFFDTKISISVSNNTNQSVTFTGYSYRISGVFQSSTISFAGGTVVAKSGETTTLESLFAKASSGDKFFISSGTSIGSQDLGVKNIAITLHGTSDLGDDVEISSSTVASFDAYNNCE